MSTFELAVSESSRFCLKLENIFNNIRYYLNQRGSDSRHLSLEAVFDLMQVLDRPDARSRLVYLLKWILDYLDDLNDKKYIDSQRIKVLKESFLSDLEYVHAVASRFGGNLFEDALLMQLRSYVSVHGQYAYHMSALCQAWKDQDDSLIFKMFQRWIEPLLPLERLITRIMRFMREHYKSHIIDADNGFAKWESSLSETIFMLAVVTPNHILPVASVGPKFISITFYIPSWGEDSVLSRYEGSVRFECMVSALLTNRRMLR